MSPRGTLRAAVLLALVGAALAVGLAISSRVGGPTLPWDDGYRLAVTVDDAHGIVPDADVLVRGVEVGSVEDVESTGSRARLRLVVEEPAAPVRADATVRIATKTLLEEAYVDLSPGARRPKLPSGASLETGQVRETTELDEALAPLAESGDSTRSMLRSLDRGLRDPQAAERLNVTVGELRHAVGEVRTLSDTLDGQEAQLAAGMAGMRAILDELAARDGSIRRLVQGASVTLATTAARAGQLDALLAELPRTLSSTRATLRTARPLVRESRPLVADLRRAAPDLTPALAEVGPVASDASDILAGLPRLRRVALPLLERTEPIVRGLRPVARELAPALANLVPIVRYVAPRREGLSALVAHGADLTGSRGRRGRAARVFNVDERGTATGRRGAFENNAYPPPGDARDPQPYEPGSYSRLRPLFRP